MDLDEITSLRDKDLRSLGVTVVEGRILVERALESDWEFLGSFIEPKAIDLESHLASRAPCKIVDRETIRKVAGYPFHRGVLAVLRRPQVREAQDVVRNAPRPRRFAACPGVENAENLGTIMRSVAAFGYDGLLVDGATTDPYGRRAMKTSMGAALTLAVGFLSGPDDLEELDLVAAVVAEDAVPLREFDVPEEHVVAFGSEGRGLGKVWVDGADYRVTIPMPPDTDSLNVGVAAGIFLYELSKSARARGG